ncbi:hydrolase, PAP2-like superfamily [Syntrophotalea carbinolica DSM 2380]|uniref:Hydrolase, PAP2-like superfamily n=1 Tax=Syntrophotalea carbinolica (strain DSM 2380 / NBRC 103641 / GraBd1) TaxID=338963 RepID=Q3A3Q5_SYNC1|nr:phosphatase PAP2 family protein [Syntrophotalea carbinolica]ABA89002.1 hydrolase, PAP2-like superfamily [Syntrophotalea carbinolica DSM 2380]
MRNYIAEILKGNRGYQTKEDIPAVGVILQHLKRIVFCFKGSLLENAILIYICFFYYMLTFVVGAFLGHRITAKIDFYYFIFFQYFIAFFFLLWSAETIYYLIKNLDMGFSGIPLIWSSSRKKYLNKETISRFLVIYSIIPLFMCSYCSLKQTIPLFHKFSFDIFLYNLDKAIHFHHSPWEILHPILGHPIITRIIDFSYLAWGSIFVYSMLYMACHKDRRLRLQFFISLSLCWVVIGNLLAILLASAGPCYFSEVTGVTPSPYAGLFEYLRSIPDLKVVFNQELLWRAFKAGIYMPLGGISAMPSMHVSIAVLLALLYRNFNRWAGWLLTVFAIVIGVGSIHLGWHYAIDGYVSTLLTILIWNAVGACFRKGVRCREKSQHSFPEGTVRIDLDSGKEDNEPQH